MTMTNPVGRNGTVVGSGYHPARSDNTSLRARSRQQGVALHHCADLLCRTLKVGFRLAGPGHNQPAVRLGHPSRSDQMFEATFSSDFDDVFVDAVCALITDREVTLPGALARHLAKRGRERENVLPKVTMGDHTVHGVHLAQGA